jgi:hypothetical protein
MDTPRKSGRQNKVEINITGLKKNTITIDGESSPSLKPQQKPGSTGRSGHRNSETTIQIEDGNEDALAEDMNKLVYNPSTITFNQDEPDEDGSLGSVDESNEHEKSDFEEDE